MEFLEKSNYQFLSQVGDVDSTTIIGQGWKSGIFLGLSTDHCREWDRYVLALRGAHICLTYMEDSLVWTKALDDKYSPKVGYSFICAEVFAQDVKWWWRGIWKIHCPAKKKLLWWATLENKIPTWDNLQKRSFVGPGWCSLCQHDLESGLHLFLNCPLSQVVWVEALSLLNLKSAWSGPTLEEAFFIWWHVAITKSYHMAPLIISWGIWIARNDVIFSDIRRSPMEIASKAVGLIAFFSDVDPPP